MCTPNIVIISYGLQISFAQRIYPKRLPLLFWCYFSWILRTSFCLYTLRGDRLCKTLFAPFQMLLCGMMSIGIDDMYLHYIQRKTLSLVYAAFSLSSSCVLFMRNICSFCKDKKTCLFRGTLPAFR